MTRKPHRRINKKRPPPPPPHSPTQKENGNNVIDYNHPKPGEGEGGGGTRPNLNSSRSDPPPDPPPPPTTTTIQEINTNLHRLHHLFLNCAQCKTSKCRTTDFSKNQRTKGLNARCKMCLIEEENQKRRNKSSKNKKLKTSPKVGEGGGLQQEPSEILNNNNDENVFPEIYHKAKAGDLEGVQRIVEQAVALAEAMEEKEESKKKNHQHIKRVVINQARRRLELDYRCSGEIKGYEWFDVTAITVAAKYGHHQIVEYLLREQADPTLRGSPEDDVFINALDAANKRLGQVLFGRNNIEERWCSRRCVELLTIVKPFWNKSSPWDSDPPWNGVSYSNKIRREEYFHTDPITDIVGYQAALDSICPLPEHPTEKDLELFAQKTKEASEAKRAIAEARSAAEQRVRDIKKAKEVIELNTIQMICSQCHTNKFGTEYSPYERSKGKNAECRVCFQNTPICCTKCQQTNPRHVYSKIELYNFVVRRMDPTCPSCLSQAERERNV